MGEELQNPTIFWATKGSTDFKPLAVEHVDGIESIDNSQVAEYSAKEYTMSFDLKLNKEQSKNLRRLLKTRTPRKLKKKHKRLVAKYLGVKLSHVRLNAIYMMHHK